MLTQKAKIEQGCFNGTIFPTPLFLLRVGGLSVDTVDNLRFEETVTWIEHILICENLLAERKSRLVDTIYQAVGRQKEKRELRHKLLDLKRDIFNVRISSNSEEARKLGNLLSLEERGLLEEWLDIWDSYQEGFLKGEGIFAQEVRQKRALLKQVIDTPDFRKGILLASPLLDQAIELYLASDNQQSNREVRTVERSLVDYLLRAAYKTSPFSTFTPICIGTFEKTNVTVDPDVIYQLEGLDKRSFIRFNMAILSKLSSMILASPEIRGELPVQIISGRYIQGNRIGYLRRTQSRDEFDEEAAVSLGTIHENIFYLPFGQIMKDLLECMGDGRKLQLSKIIHQLRTDLQYDDADREIESYLQHLLRLGFLLIPALHIDIHCKYPLVHYRERLAAIGSQALYTVATHLREIETLLLVYEAAPVSERRQLLAEIKHQIKKSYCVLGQQQATVPRTIIYEDTTLNPKKLEINEIAWRDILSNVAEFQHLMPLFDISLPRKIITRGYFRARIGAEQRYDNFLSFANEFLQSFYEQYLRDERGSQEGGRNFTSYQNYFDQSEITLLNEARQAIADYTGTSYKKLPTASRELILGDDFLEVISPYVPKNSGELHSHALFSQFARVDGEPLLIINQIYTGFTQMFSRFGHCFNEEDGYQLVPRLRAHLEKLQPPKAVFAEMTGGYENTNLNLHPHVTPYELICPGESSTRPKCEQIPLEDLYIQDDDQEGHLRLYSKRLGKQIIPLYLGFLLPTALPEIQQVLLNFSGFSACPINAWYGIQGENMRSGISFYPRLRYKNLVLQRAHWIIQPDYFPQRDSGQSDLHYFVNISKWRKQNGLPSRVFVTSEISPKSTSEGADGKMRARKPLYVDFENYFSVSLLETMVRSTSPWLMIAEMLPHHNHLWLKYNGHSYVSEFVWEMNHFKKGSDEY